MAFHALGFEVSLLVVVTIQTAGILISFLTLLPGALGSGEIIGVALYSIFLGISRAELTSTILLARLLNFWVYAVVGAVLLATFEEKVLSFEGL